MVITVAEKVLITGGVLNLAYGLLLGYAIVVIRAKGAPATPVPDGGARRHAAAGRGSAWAGVGGPAVHARPGRTWPPGWSLSPPH
jgi:hypothetical protein